MKKLYAALFSAALATGMAVPYALSHSTGRESRAVRDCEAAQPGSPGLSCVRRPVHSSTTITPTIPLVRAAVPTTASHSVLRGDPRSLPVFFRRFRLPEARFCAPLSGLFTDGFLRARLKLL